MARLKATGYEPGLWYTRYARGNFGTNFGGPFFPQRGTSTAAENYPGRTTQLARSRPISWP